MAHQTTVSVRVYTLVLLALIALTLLTVGISFVPLSANWHVGLGLSIGGAKAVLVVIFFMHLFRSPKLIWAVVAVALFWLLIVLMLLTFCDYVTRGLIPGMPGHG